MMRKILALILVLSASGWAQDNSEDAIILNQELEFLEEAAKGVSIQSLKSSDGPVATGIEVNNSESLEALYFGDSTEAIRTRQAAPQRRSRQRDD
jgi:hypothetical protein